jgi:hypothetical protein
MNILATCTFLPLKCQFNRGIFAINLVASWLCMYTQQYFMYPGTLLQKDTHLNLYPFKNVRNLWYRVHVLLSALCVSCTSSTCSLLVPVLLCQLCVCTAVKVQGAHMHKPYPISSTVFVRYIYPAYNFKQFSCLSLPRSAQASLMTTILNPCSNKPYALCCTHALVIKPHITTVSIPIERHR